ncbi:hypothetical protein [Microbulbifer sp. JMSA003]|uniref:hypothetical protein n=1 Tax=Microbulbifer sp. JMSA003 TaxID=3243369 RepID=UPI004039CB25
MSKISFYKVMAVSLFVLSAIFAILVSFLVEFICGSMSVVPQFVKNVAFVLSLVPMSLAAVLVRKKFSDRDR